MGPKTGDPGKKPGVLSMLETPLLERVKARDEKQKVVRLSTSHESRKCQLGFGAGSRRLSKTRWRNDGADCGGKHVCARQKGRVLEQCRCIKGH